MTKKTYDGVLAEKLPLGIKLTIQTSGDLPDDLELQVEYTQSSHLASLFSTENGMEHLFPLLRRGQCPSCRGTLDEEIDYEAVLHIYGPEEVSPERLEELQAECKAKPPNTNLVTYQSQPLSYQPLPYQPLPSQPALWTQTAQQPSLPATSSKDCVLALNGRNHVIPRVVIEEAAAKVPRLEEILSRDETETQNWNRG